MVKAWHPTKTRFEPVGVRGEDVEAWREHVFEPHLYLSGGFGRLDRFADKASRSAPPVKRPTSGQSARPQLDGNLLPVSVARVDASHFGRSCQGLGARTWVLPTAITRFGLVWSGSLLSSLSK